EEQNGKDRAEYGKGILKELSNQLTKQFGKGFSETNLKQMRQFYLNYSIGQTLSDNSDPPKSSTLPRKSFEENSESTQPNFQFNLSWSHYIKLMRIEDEMERKFYEIESQKNNWSVRELNRQYDSALYTRLVLSKDKGKIKELSEKGLIIE